MMCMTIRRGLLQSVSSYLQVQLYAIQPGYSNVHQERTIYMCLFIFYLSLFICLFYLFNYAAMRRGEAYTRGSVPVDP